MLPPAVLLITRLIPEPERLADMGIRVAITPLDPPGESVLLGV